MSVNKNQLSAPKQTSSLQSVDNSVIIESQQLNSNCTVSQVQYHCNVCTFKASDENKLKIHSNKHNYLKAVCADYKKLASGKVNIEDAYFCTTCKLSFSGKGIIAYHNKYECKNVVDTQKSSNASTITAEPTNENANLQPKECAAVVSEDDNSDCSEDYYDSSYVKTSTRKKRKVDPILIQNPESTLPKYRYSQVHKLNDLADLNDKNIPDDVRVLNIATAQIIDRTIKCFRCNIFFKTYKDLKDHLDKWHNDELTQLNNHFTNVTPHFTCTVQHRCTGCSSTFATVRSATKHYYKDCAGKPVNEVKEPHSESKDVLESEITISEECDASDAELLTYLQNAAHNNQISSRALPSDDNLIKIATMQVNDRGIKCIRCNLPFTSYKELNIHLSKVHGKELDELSNLYQQNSIKIQHKCSKCTLTFPSVRLLTKHYKECKAPKQQIVISIPCKQTPCKPRRSPRRKQK